MRVGTTYEFHPVLMDRTVGIEPGTIVRICYGPGLGKQQAPAPFVYVEHLDGTFAGMVVRASLTRVVYKRGVWEPKGFRPVFGPANREAK